MKPILVFGSINADVSVRVPRLPALGETLAGDEALLSPGGKGANQAHAARLADVPVRLVGAVGDDGFAHLTLERLETAGVDLGGVRRQVASATGLALIQVTEDGDNAITLALGANSLVRADWVSDQALQAHEWLLLQGEIELEQSIKLAARMRAQGGQVIFNAAPARQLDELDLGVVDWCVLNESELAELSRHLGLQGQGEEAAHELARRLRRGLLLTRGARGVFACGPGLGELRVPAWRVDVLDSTGAGDTFCGVWAAAMAEGMAIEPALRVASAAAALCCTRRGAQAAQPKRADIENFLVNASPHV